MSIFKRTFRNRQKFNQPTKGNRMILAIFSFLKGRFSKEAISEAKSNETRMSRQEALQQMRNLANKRVKKG